MDKVRESGEIDENTMAYFTSELVSMDDAEARVSVPIFANYSIMNEKLSFIEGCLEEVVGKKLKIRIFLQDELNKISNQQSGVDDSFKSSFIFREIDPSLTFGSFVVGKSNSQAHLASITCAENPGLVYNPLFIFGNSGLGKTHLLNAIGNQVKLKFPDKKIGYVSGEEFVEGVAKASKDGKLDLFKETFYHLDFLLVDDIQFIAGKDKTHEIFFTIFNNLTNNKKQICITADRNPEEIKGLEERIISRFYQGLTVNIEAPEYETSINILKSEIQNSSSINQLSDIDDEVFNYLATNFSQDVRKLKGSIKRLLFYSAGFGNKDDNGHISIQLAMEAFKDEINVGKNDLSIPLIRKVVCDYYNLTKQQIISATRTKNIANARHVAMYMCRKLLDAPYKDIGLEFGKRDHTTVMASCEKIEQLVKTDPLYHQVISEIESKIKR